MGQRDSLEKKAQKIIGAWNPNKEEEQKTKVSNDNDSKILKTKFTRKYLSFQTV